jgi:hypothetical protein
MQRSIIAWVALLWIFTVVSIVSLTDCLWKRIYSLNEACLVDRNFNVSNLLSCLFFISYVTTTYLSFILLSFFIVWTAPSLRFQLLLPWSSWRKIGDAS